MRYILFILASLTWTACASILHVPNEYPERTGTTDPLVSATVGKGKSGQRILIGFGVGAALGALVGAAIVDHVNEFDFVGDNSDTERWKGAVIGSVVGAGLGALIAVATTKKGKRRRPPPHIPDKITSYLSTSARPTGVRDVTLTAPPFPPIFPPTASPPGTTP